MIFFPMALLFYCIAKDILKLFLMQSINYIKKETQELRHKLLFGNSTNKKVSFVFLESLFIMFLGQMLTSAFPSLLVEVNNFMGF